MSKKQWGFKHAIITVFNLVSLIYDGLGDSGSENPDEDIKAFMEGAPYSKRLGEVVFGEMLYSCWQTKVEDFEFRVDFLAMKARRNLTKNEVEKIAEIQGLSLGYVPESDSFMEDLESLLAMFPKVKMTLIGMPVDERGSVPIVSGSTKNVIGWRKLDEGISKGEVIAVVRYLE